jgi:hypothetical protein
VAKNLPYKVQTAAGVKTMIPEGSGKGLTIPQSSIILSPDEIKKLAQSVKDARTWSPSAEDDIRAFNDYLRKRFQVLEKNFGTKQRWQGLNAGDIQARKELWDSLREAFWVRSYLRSHYGMPLGALVIQYDTSWFRLDKFFTSTENLLKFKEDTAWEENELAAGERDYRKAMSVAYERDPERAATYADGVFKGEVNWLGKVNEFMTWVGGKAPLATAIALCHTLLAADLYEERLLVTMGGFDKMYARYKERYFSTANDTEFYGHLQDVYFGDAATDVGLGRDSLAGHLAQIKVDLQGKEAELILAREQQEQIDLFMKQGRERSPFRRPERPGQPKAEKQ